MDCERSTSAYWSACGRGRSVALFVIWGDSDNFLLRPRRVWIHSFLQAAGRAQPANPAVGSDEAAAGLPMQQRQWLVHQRDNEELGPACAEANTKQEEMKPNHQ